MKVLNWILSHQGLQLHPLFLLVHAVDVRTGFCTAPTVYSIPIAFFLGAVLVLATGAGVLLA